MSDEYESFTNLFIPNNETLNNQHKKYKLKKQKGGNDNNDDQSSSDINSEDLDQIFGMKYNAQNTCYDKDWLLYKLNSIIDEYEDIVSLERDMIESLDRLGVTKGEDIVECKKTVQLMRRRIENFANLKRIVEDVPEENPEDNYSSGGSLFVNSNNNTKKDKSKTMYYLVK